MHKVKKTTTTKEWQTNKQGSKKKRKTTKAFLLVCLCMAHLKTEQSKWLEFFSPSCLYNKKTIEDEKKKQESRQNNNKLSVYIIKIKLTETRIFNGKKRKFSFDILLWNRSAMCEISFFFFFLKKNSVQVFHQELPI